MDIVCGRPAARDGSLEVDLDELIVEALGVSIGELGDDEGEGP